MVSQGYLCAAGRIPFLLLLLHSFLDKPLPTSSLPLSHYMSGVGVKEDKEWTLKASSCSECMLLRVRRSGSLSSSLVYTAVSLGGWFLAMRLRSARISVSCSASTEFTLVSFSLKSNMEVSSSPAPMARSASTPYFLPPRKVTVHSVAPAEGVVVGALGEAVGVGWALAHGGDVRQSVGAAVPWAGGLGTLRTHAAGGWGRLGSGGQVVLVVLPLRNAGHPVGGDSAVANNAHTHVLAVRGGVGGPAGGEAASLLLVSSWWARVTEPITSSSPLSDAEPEEEVELVSMATTGSGSEPDEQEWACSTWSARGGAVGGERRRDGCCRDGCRHRRSERLVAVDVAISLDIPTIRHFLKRHCWQRLRLLRMMGQPSFFRHFLYWMFCWMLRLKKPCGGGGAGGGGQHYNNYN
ncbi:hypothetical protein N1851_033881 [Merluccius polli]|uniref:Uncharacterized protein n=1 Tax=Merluccius polli TaxID=89951 RepID=A0AA47M0N7_MERPO|nr:hypothetical protein N1851_033881 [Merluccius polli]